MVSQDPNDPNFGLETDETSPNFGLPPQQQEGGLVKGLQTAQKALGIASDVYLYGAGALHNIAFPEEAKLLKTPLVSPEVVQPVRKALQYPVQTLNQIVTGQQFEEPLAGLGEFASEQIAGQTSPEALGLLATGGIVAKIPKLREIAFGKPPEVIPEIPEPLAAEARAATTPEEVIPSATQERQIPESNIPEYPGDETSRPPAETSGGGGIVAGPEVQETIAPEAEPQPPAAAAPEVAPEIPVTEEPAPVPEAEAPATAAPIPETEPIAAPEVAPPAPPEVPPTIEGSVETPPEVRQQTGISNQRLTEAYGDSAPVATTGKGPGAWKDEGLSRLDNFQKTGDVKNDPYTVLTNLREGKVPMADVASDVSLLRAEHQRLLEDARNAEGTPEYEAKSQAALDMATSIKGVAHGPASDVFRALQEYDKPRYDNVTDFDQALREREGRESTSSERVQFKQIADDVSNTRNGAEQEINGAQKRLNKFPRMKFDEAFKNVHDQITELTKDCVL